MADTPSDKKRTERTTAAPGLFTSELVRRSKRPRVSPQPTSESPGLPPPFSRSRSRRHLSYLYGLAVVCVFVGAVIGLIYQQKLIAERRAEMLRKCLETFATGAFRTCRDRCGQFRGRFKSGTDVELAETLSTLARECQIVSGGRGELENYLRTARLLRELEESGELVFPATDETWDRLVARVKERVRYTLRGGIEGLLEELIHAPTPEHVELVNALRAHAAGEPILEDVLPTNIEQVLQKVEQLRRRRTASQKLSETLEQLAQHPNVDTIVAALENLNSIKFDLTETEFQAAADRVRRLIERHVGISELSDPTVPPRLEPASDGAIPIKWPLPDTEQTFSPLRSVCLPLASGVVLLHVDRKEYALYRGLRLFGHSLDQEPCWFVGASQDSRWEIYRIRFDGTVDPLLALSRRPKQVVGLGGTVVIAAGEDLYLVSAGEVARIRLPEPAAGAVLVRGGKQAVALGRSGVLYDIDVDEPLVRVLLPPVPGATSGMRAGSYDDFVVVCRRLVGGAGSVEVYRWKDGSLRLYGLRDWQSDQPWSVPAFARGCVYVATKQGYLLGYRVPGEPVDRLEPAGEAARLRPEGQRAQADGPGLFRVGADTLLAVSDGTVFLFEPRPTQGAIVQRWRTALDRPHSRVAAVIPISSKRVALVRTTVGSGAAACEVVSLTNGSIEGAIEVGLATVEAAVVSDGVGVLDGDGNVWGFRGYNGQGFAGWGLSTEKLAVGVERLLGLSDRLLLLVSPNRLRLFDGNGLIPLDGPSPSTASDCAVCPLSGAWVGGVGRERIPGVCFVGPAGCVFVYVCIGDQPSGWTLLASSSVDLDVPRGNGSSGGHLLVASAPSAAMLAVGRRGSDQLVLLKRVPDEQGNVLSSLASVTLPGPLANLWWVVPDRVHVVLKGAPLCRVLVSARPQVDYERFPDMAGSVFVGAVLVGYDERGAIWAFKLGPKGGLRPVWSTLLPPTAAPLVLGPAAGDGLVLASYYAEGVWRGVLLSASDGEPVADLPPTARPVAFWREGDVAYVLSSDGALTRVRCPGQAPHRD